MSEFSGLWKHYNTACFLGWVAQLSQHGFPQKSNLTFQRENPNGIKLPSFKPCHSISLSSFHRTLHLVLFDRRVNHFLLFLGPRTVEQSNVASEPSDISPLPNGMNCPGASGRQTIYSFRSTLMPQFCHSL